MPVEVHTGSEYGWIKEVVKERPRKIEPLRFSSRDIHGVLWTWQKEGWPQRLIVSAMPSRLVEYPSPTCGLSMVRMWAEGMDIEMNIPVAELPHVMLGGTFVITTVLPMGNDELIQPVEGLSEALTDIYGLRR